VAKRSVRYAHVHDWRSQLLPVVTIIGLLSYVRPKNQFMMYDDTTCDWDELPLDFIDEFKAHGLPSAVYLASFGCLLYVMASCQVAARQDTPLLWRLWYMDLNLVKSIMKTYLPHHQSTTTMVTDTPTTKTTTTTTTISSSSSGDTEMKYKSTHDSLLEIGIVPLATQSASSSPLPVATITATVATTKGGVAVDGTNNNNNNNNSENKKMDIPIEVRKQLRDQWVELPSIEYGLSSEGNSLFFGVAPVALPFPFGHQSK
jgi:hypothetical protein